jgi:hypothetical protein
MTEKKPILFKEIGVNDQFPYTKIDISKAVRLGDNFAVSFYQIDYQAIANVLNGQSKHSLDDIKLMPIVKVVMNKEMFNQLRDEVNTLYDLVEKDNLSLGK